MHQLSVNLRRVVPYYVLWIITISGVFTWSISYLSFDPSFPYYNDLSGIYSRFIATFAHFDGIHYLRLIKNGYDDTGSQAFFPLYSLLIRALTFNFFDPLHVAIFFNAFASLTALVIATIHLKGKSTITYVLLLLSFPASFFLLTNYTESFFILLVTIFFYLLYEKKYLLAAMIASLASATRLVGIFLALSLLYELISERKSWKYVAILTILSISGLLAYMAFLQYRFEDPLMFIHVQSMFNNGRSGSEIISLPQVVYRYARILLTTAPSSITYFRAMWEAVLFAITMVSLYVYRHNMRRSSLIFCICALLLPTLSGTLSSFPRYVLVAVPLFQVIAEEITPRLRASIIFLQYAILIFVVALFAQGIFIA